jgi:hypothetical protein
MRTLPSYPTVIPAEAGTQTLLKVRRLSLGSRFRGNDKR